jgi:hypothetical protein
LLQRRYAVTKCKSIYYLYARAAMELTFHAVQWPERRHFFDEHFVELPLSFAAARICRCVNRFWYHSTILFWLSLLKRPYALKSLRLWSRDR